MKNSCRFEGYLSKKFEGSFVMNTVERVPEGVVIEAMGVNRDSEEEFGILFFDEIFDLVERISAGKRVANHTDNKSSEIQISVAGDAFVDEVD